MFKKNKNKLNFIRIFNICFLSLFVSVLFSCSSSKPIQIKTSSSEEILIVCKNKRTYTFLIEDRYTGELKLVEIKK